MTERFIPGEGTDLAAGSEGFALITKGLTDALGELKDIGMTGAAGQGRGFGELALSGLDVGHGDLTDAFRSFCERWEWGVRSLIDEGNTFAEDVGLSAGTYYETDQYVDGALKTVVNSAFGDPYLSEQEVADRSWGQVVGDNPVTQAAHPDYSGDSFQAAYRNSVDAWQHADQAPGTTESFTAAGQDPPTDTGQPADGGRADAEPHRSWTPRQQQPDDDAH
ncbi:hypothetical protein [Streptomyces sp. NPDC050560]|uniref:hypothetical protein n=1 Tax=Streptomyces sp. NPDC050560 TaxID=3365630 RepID=UPI0037B641A9